MVPTPVVFSYPNMPHGSLMTFPDKMPWPGPKWVQKTWIGVGFGGDPTHVEDLLPKRSNLVPIVDRTSGEAMMLAYCADIDMHATSAGPPVGTTVCSYKEAGLLVRCRQTGQGHPSEGLFCLVLYVDHFDAIVIGRETFGFPKKAAEIALTSDGWTVRHRGGLVIDLAMHPPSNARPADTSWWSDPWFLEKLIPAAGGGTALGGGHIHELITIPWKVTPGQDPVRWHTAELQLLDGGQQPPGWASDDLSPLQVGAGRRTCLSLSQTLEIDLEHLRVSPLV